MYSEHITEQQPFMLHRRKKRSLTDTEKDQIYQFHQENPLVTHNNIAGMSFWYSFESNAWLILTIFLLVALFGVDRRSVTGIMFTQLLSTCDFPTY